MPRLPGVEKVTRVSTDGLRLPALQAPATDPTGAALQGFGASLGSFGKALDEFDKKQKLLKAAEDEAKKSALDSDLTVGRAEMFANPPKMDESDFGGDVEPDPLKRGEKMIDLLIESKLEEHIGTPFEADARRIAEVHRVPFVTRLKLDTHHAQAEAAVARLRGAADVLVTAALAEPANLPRFLNDGERKLEALGKVLDWSPERQAVETAQYRKNFVTDVLNGRVKRGEASFVRDLLQQGAFKSFLDAETTAGLIKTAEAQFAAEMNSFEIESGAHFKKIEETGTGDPRVAAEAAAKLPDGEFDTFQVGERRAQHVHDFVTRHRALPDAEIDAAINAQRSSDTTDDEGQKTFDVTEGAARRLMAERRRDGGAAADHDPGVIAAVERGDKEAAVSLRKAAQKRWGQPEELIRAVSRKEAQSLAGNLDDLEGQFLVTELQKMKDEYGANFDLVRREMAREGADPETMAMTLHIDNSKATQVLQQVVRVPYAKLANDIAPEDIATLKAEIASRFEAGELTDGRIDRSVIEKIGLLNLAKNGDPIKAARQALRLGKNANIPRDGDDALIGGNGDDKIAVGQGADELTQGGIQTQSGNEQEGRLEPPVSGATGGAEVPFSGAPGTEVGGPPQGLPSGIQEFGDEFNKHARGVLGPAYEPAVGLLRIVELLSPVADVKDMMEGSRETTEGIRNLDAGRVAKGMSLMIGGFATLALPGSASQMAKMVDETVSRAKAALGDLGADVASAGRAGVRPDESAIKESTEIIRAEVARSSGEVKDLTGDIANDEFASGMKERPDFDPTREIHPPYVPGTKVHDIEAAGVEGEYVRVISPNEEGDLIERGRWLMRADKFNEIIKHSNAREILRDLFALPDVPTHFSRVTVPKGETLRVGITNEHPEWGRGGAVQYEAICGPDRNWFGDAEEITVSNNR